jgi:hypothetical protein
LGGVDHEMEIVVSHEPVAQKLLGFEKMMKICTIVILADMAGAFWIKRKLIVFEF